MTHTGTPVVDGRRAEPADWRVVPLHEAPGHLDTLAAWHGAAWAHLYAGWDAATAREDYQQHREDGATPYTLLALAGDELLGSISLVRDDLPGWACPDPWLASFLVAPHHRRRGIGAALISAALAHAEAQGWPRLLLFTESAQDYFTRFGFVACGRHTAAGQAVTVMQRAVCAQGASST